MIINIGNNCYNNHNQGNHTTNIYSNHYRSNRSNRSNRSINHNSYHDDDEATRETTHIFTTQLGVWNNL